MQAAVIQNPNSSMVTYRSGATVIKCQKIGSKFWIHVEILTHSSVLNVTFIVNILHFQVWNYLFVEIFLCYVFITIDDILTYNSSQILPQEKWTNIKICATIFDLHSCLSEICYFNFILWHSEVKMTLICKMLVLRMYVLILIILTATIA